MTSDELETPARIEPALLTETATPIADLIAQLSADSAILGVTLQPATAAQLAGLVRIMNTYYSNLIEGHNTRPREIERALAGDFETETQRRNLQREAVAHVRVQTLVDEMAANGTLPEPASSSFIKWLHKEFYRDAPEEMLQIRGTTTEFRMEPGVWRSNPEHDVAVGRHIPPSSDRVEDFMSYFQDRYSFEKLGKASRILAIAGAHHRFNYIHPFPDGNGRVSRLMSHAMALKAGVGAHGLWSISRGLARGIDSRSEYKMMMDLADMPRRGDLDGRGNLSQQALDQFTEWFLKVCCDQVEFMTGLFDFGTLDKRLKRYVDRHETLKPEAAELLQEALIRGEFERGEIERITKLPERTARRVLRDVVEEGLLASETPKGKVSLRFPAKALDQLFPQLFPET